MRRQKRRYRDAEGVEEGWEWGGVSLSQPTRESGTASRAPQPGPGADPRLQTSVQHFLSVTERFRRKENSA